MPLRPIFIFAFFLFLAAYCLSLVLPILRRNLLDTPSARSSHLIPTPSGGGLVFVFLTTISCFFEIYIAFFAGSVTPSVLDRTFLIPIYSLPLSLLGLLDDRFSLSISIRLVIQFFTALALISLCPLITSFNPFFPLSILCFFLLLLVVVSLINFINFMDGLDGLVAGCLLISISTLVFHLTASWIYLSLIGSLAGFIFWNWSPARVFMGDTGSTFLGAVFAGLVLQASSWPECTGFFLLAFPLVGDALVCIIRRFLAGDRVFQPHRLHLYQRLHQSGWPHARVSLLYILATFILALSFLTGGLGLLSALVLLQFIVALWLDRFVAVPFSVASSHS